MEVEAGGGQSGDQNLLCYLLKASHKCSWRIQTSFPSHQEKFLQCKVLTVIWLVPRWDGGPKGKKMRSSLGEEEFESVFYRQRCTKIVGNCLCQLEMRVTPYNSKRPVTLGLASPPYPHHTPCHALWQSSSPDFHRSGGSLLHIVNSGSSLWIPHVLFLFHASGADVDKVCVWENG